MTLSIIDDERLGVERHARRQITTNREADPTGNAFADDGNNLLKLAHDHGGRAGRKG
jgi:hypothetical protein